MKEKTEKIAGFREFFQEAKAREKSTNLREYTDRLLFQDTVRKNLEKLKEEGFSIQEGLIQITPWRKKVEGFEKPDFIVSKEDIFFHLYLMVTEDMGFLKRDFLWGLFDVMQANPNVTALIPVWHFEDLPSCALDPFILRKYIERTEDNISLLDEKISGLKNTILNFYNYQFVDWSIPEEFVIGEGEEVKFTVTDVLRQNLNQKLNELEDKAFRIREKREAQKSVLKVDRGRILNKLMDLLAKPTLDKADFDKLESFLDRELKKTKTEDD